MLPNVIVVGLNDHHQNRSNGLWLVTIYTSRFEEERHSPFHHHLHKRKLDIILFYYEVFKLFFEH